MARPLRPHHVDRTEVRRRHRTWMRAMVLATLGWGTWWAWVALTKWLPGWAPPVEWVYALTSGLAAVGAFLGFFTIRARRAWLILAMVPMGANLSLLSVPVLFGDEVRHWEQEAADRRAAETREP